MILDFRRVAGLDSAAVQSFRRILDGARAAGVRLIFADISAEVLQILTRGGLSFSGSGSAVLAEDFDAALAACERSILETVDPAIAESHPRPLGAQLLSLLGNEADAAELARAFERREFEAGMPLIQQGTNSDDIYLIEAGRARVCLSAGDETLTLATLGPGAFVGELSFYLGRPRSASVISEDGVVAWCLDRSRLAEIEARFPHIVSKFHAAMATMLADRVSATNRLLRFFAE
jgi:sulfate permease, SulP family